MTSLLQIVDDPQGGSRFVDLELDLDPAEGGLHISEAAAVSSAWIFAAPAGGGHPQQPEARRQLAVVLTGSCTVTVSSGETRTCRPGDLLLVEDTDGVGHSSSSEEGAAILMVALEEEELRPFFSGRQELANEGRAR